MKNTKIYSYIIGIAVVISISFFIQGCSDESEHMNNSSDNQKIESLVSSTEYKALNENIQSIGAKLKSNYSVLTDTEKDKVINILNKINENSCSQEELDVLFKEFNSFMKINFKATADDINSDVVALNLYKESNRISNKEFSLAVNMYSKCNVPRLKSNTENEKDISDCISACGAIAAVCFMVSGGGASPLCIAAFAACCLGC